MWILYFFSPHISMHEAKLLFSSSRSRLRPMNTSIFSEFPSIIFVASMVPPISIWTACNTYGCFSPIKLITPFVRNMSVPRSIKSLRIHCWKASRPTRPLHFMPTELTDWSCYWLTRICVFCLACLVFLIGKKFGVTFNNAWQIKSFDIQNQIQINYTVLAFEDLCASVDLTNTVL